MDNGLIRFFLFNCETFIGFENLEKGYSKKTEFSFNI